MVLNTVTEIGESGRTENANYYLTARVNEPVFRAVLRTLRTPEIRKVLGDCEICVPQDFNPEKSLASIFDKYSRGNRYAKFTISDFVVSPGSRAAILIEDIAAVTGGAAELSYLVVGSDSVSYLGKAQSLILGQPQVRRVCATNPNL